MSIRKIYHCDQDLVIEWDDGHTAKVSIAWLKAMVASKTYEFDKLEGGGCSSSWKPNKFDKTDGGG